METSRKLGEILVERELLCKKSVERVVTMANKLGKRFGVMLEELGLVSETELAEAPGAQYGMKTLLDFAKTNFSPDALNIVTAEFALEHTLFPLHLSGGKLASEQLGVGTPSQD